MADTCEVVALGRDDVCLEPKKLISSYETMQLTKAADNLAEPRPWLSPEAAGLLQAAQRLIVLGAPADHKKPSPSSF